MIRQESHKKQSIFRKDSQVLFLQPWPSVPFLLRVASAKEGKILDDGEEVFLQGDVNIRRPGQTESVITMNTRDLRILRNEDFAETSSSVVMQQNNNTVTAVGMQAHFGQGEVDFLKDVRGWYLE